MEQKHIGEQNLNYQGVMMEVVAYRKCNDIDIMFLDGTSTIKSTRYCHFKSGRVMYSAATKTGHIREERKARRAKLAHMAGGDEIRRVSVAPSYFVDRLGNVYSSTGRKLKPQTTKNGYRRYDLPSFGKAHQLLLAHRLVAEAFIPNPQNKPQVNHINGDKTDNRVENLEWCTRSENQKHRFSHLGHSHQGEKNTRAKLSWEDVKEIISLRDDGCSNREVAERYGIAKSTVSAIYNRKRWARL